MIPARRSPRGFTLAELMVAMAIGTVVLVTAVAMLGRSGDEYSRIGGNIGSEREARAVVNQLTEDLHTARFHAAGIFEKSNAAWPVDRLGMLVLQPADAQSAAGQIGDLCAVHYYTGDLTINGRTVRCLMRGVRESRDTFAALGRGEAATLFRPGERDEPLAFGVLAFEARPKSRDEAGAWIDWTPNPTVAPEAVAVRIVLARRETAAKLTSAGAWSGGGASKLLGTNATAAENRNLEVYTSIIRFAGGKPRL